MNALPVLQGFPIHALPLIAQNSALELQKNTGAPLGLIAASTLTAMSLAMQGLINLRRMDGLEGPASAWFLVVGESGERKTAIDEKNLTSIREFDTEQAERFEKEMNKFDVAMLAWHAEQKVILNAIRKSAAKEECTDFLKERLTDHAATAPKKPRLVRLLYNDVTPAAIKEALYEHWNSMGLISDEGASILSGHSIRDLSLLNRIWGGAKVQVDRAGKKSITINDPRLTISVMTQPGPLRRYLERRGEEAQDTGFLGRFSVTYPPTTQGSRYISCPVTSWEHLPKFLARIRVLAEMNIGPDGEPTKKIVLSFSPEAQARWIYAYNEIESRLNPGQVFFNVKDYAAKLADNLARLAALFHFFERNEGQISLDALERAIAVSAWFSDEFIRLFSPSPQVPQEQFDAQRLEIWFAQYVKRVGMLVDIKRNYVFQCVTPITLRNKNRFSFALDVLFGCGKIQIFMQGKTRWIRLSPSYFTPQQIEWLCGQGAMNG